MEKRGSLAWRAMGRTMSSTSSAVNPAAAWRRRRSPGSQGPAPAVRATSRAGRRLGGCARVRRGVAGDVERLRVEGATLLAQPETVGAAGRDGGLDDVVAQQPPVLEVDGDHLAGAQAALLEDVLAGQVHRAGLGGEREQAGAGARVAGRAQAVAVHAGAGVAAVGEGDERRPVPGLLQAGVVLVELGDPRVAAGARVLVGGRQGHHQRLERAAAAAHQQLDELVQGAGVAAVAVDHGQQVGDARAPHRSRQLRLPGAHPREVAEQRVDLAVVRQQAHGLGEAPLGRRVGAEAAVQHGVGAHERGVLQVRIELGQHRGGDHALVDHRPRRQRADVEVVQAPDDGLAEERLADGPAGQEQGALELVAGQDGRLGDDLLHVRVTLAHARGQRLGAQRHGAPADHHQALVAERLGDQLPGQVALALLPRQEHHADRGRERPRLGDALLGEPRLEHAPGDRRQDAGAVRGFAVGADPAAMLHRGERAEGELDHFAVRLARHARDQPDAAGGVVAPGGARERGRQAGGHEVIGVRCGQTVLATGGVMDILDHARPLSDLPRPPGPVRIYASIRRHPPP